MPALTVFAGPNGSGKSSIVRRSAFEGKERLLDPDAIARLLNPAASEQSAIEAGREVLRRTREYIRRQESFAVETTLSGNWTTSVIRTAIESLYYVTLIYICVDTPEKSIQRVRERVARGGHHVSDDDVRRRYVRSLANAALILPLVHQALVFDNSADEPRLVLEMRDGAVTSITAHPPAWASALLPGPK